jgi:hypothetical protein
MIVMGIPFVAGLAAASQPTVNAATVDAMPLMAWRRLMGSSDGFGGGMRGSMVVA